MLSAVAITYNEEAHIERYITQLSFADEIIIVDSFSTDRTVEIAEKHNVKIVEREFDDFSSQKNFAIDQATHDWIVFFDLDEDISEELGKEILNITTSSNPCNAYRAQRNFHFMGKRMKYSGFQTDMSIRLFKKGFGRYSNKPVHETLEVNGTICNLKTPLEHYTYKSFDNYNQKLTKYGKLQAKQLFEKGVRPNLYHFLFRPLYRFLHQYFLRLGILDGKEGFILCYAHAFSVFKRYLFLWAMYRNIE